MQSANMPSSVNFVCLNEEWGPYKTLLCKNMY